MATNWSVKVWRSVLDGSINATLYEDGRMLDDINALRTLAGMWTPVRYWFRPLERRVEKATNELLAYGAYLERRRRRGDVDVARLNEIARAIVDKR